MSYNELVINGFMALFLSSCTHLKEKNNSENNQPPPKLLKPEVKKVLAAVDCFQNYRKKCYYRENEEKICGERNDWHFKIHCFLSADKNHRTIERREATDG
jgi:hypothetical protein